MKRDGSAPVALAWLRLRHYMFQLGWPALLGLGLAAGAVAVDVIASDQIDARIGELRKTRNALRARLASESKQAESRGVQVADLLDRTGIDPVVNDLHAAAQKNSVRLEQGEYRLQAEQGTRLARYRIVFPAKGSYPQLHAWLDEAIAARPGLMVEELTLKREDIGNENLEARVSLSLLVRDK